MEIEERLTLEPEATETEQEEFYERVYQKLLRTDMALVPVNYDREEVAIILGAYVPRGESS